MNLLMSQQSSLKRHGDDKLMVRARRDFLEKGYYAPLRKAISTAVVKELSDGVLVDVGCGEGYYTSEIADNKGLKIFALIFPRML